MNRYQQVASCLLSQYGALPERESRIRVVLTGQYDLKIWRDGRGADLLELQPHGQGEVLFEQSAWAYNAGFVSSPVPGIDYDHANGASEYGF